MRARLAGIPRPLVLLLVVAALVGIAWAAVVPPFQGPDESEHFAYVQHLAETGTIPSPTRYIGAGSHSSEEKRALDTLGLRATMSYGAARPAWSELDQRAWARFEQTLPSSARKDGGGLNPIAKNPPLYYAYASVAYDASLDHSLFGRLMTVRLAGVLLFVLIVALTWIAASELTRRTWAKLLAAGVVALEPQLAFMSGISNSDILLVAIWTAFVALTLRTVKRGPTTWRVLGLFALGALSPLTHGRGLALLPALAVVLAVIAWQYRPPLRSALAWLGGGLALIVAALVLVRTLHGAGGGGGGATLYGGQTNYINQAGFSVSGLLSQVWRFYLPALPGMHRIGPDYGFRQMWVDTFYGDFGWLDARYPTRLYAALRLATLLGIAALLASLIVRWRMVREQWPVLVCLAAIGFALVALLQLVSYLSLLGSSDPLIVGRYGLPLISLFALAVMFVATSLPRRFGPALTAILLGGGVVLQLAGLGLTVGRFYA